MKISKVISIHIYFWQERQFSHRQSLHEKGKSILTLQSLYTKKIILQNVPPPLLIFWLRPSTYTVFQFLLF